MIEADKYRWWQICTPWQGVAYGKFKPTLKRVINSRLQDDPFGNWRYNIAIL